MLVPVIIIITHPLHDPYIHSSLTQTHLRSHTCSRQHMTAHTHTRTHSYIRCCYGTAIESFSKLGDSIYFHNDASEGPPELWVLQYISSAVRWADAGITLTQVVDYGFGQAGGGNLSLFTNITISGGLDSFDSSASTSRLPSVRRNNQAFAKKHRVCGVLDFFLLDP